MDALRLADEIFLIGHDENTGKAHVSDTVLSTVLAGAVLGEHVLDDRITITDESLVMLRSDDAGLDQAADAVLGEVRSRGDQFSVRAWAEHLRESAPSLVAARLVRLGLVEQVEPRSVLRGGIRYPALDRLAGAAPVARLRFMLERPGELDQQTAALAGFLLASGLEFVIGGEGKKAIREALLGMVQTLSPPMRALLAGVDSAIAALVLGGRR